MIEGYGTDKEMESPGGAGILAYLPSILWQRRWWIAVPLILCSIAGVVAAFVLPSSYRSSATLLVESPQLPTELVGGGSQQTSVIDKRIAKVRQQVLSRPDLIELIENNDLYGEARQKKPLSEVIEDMRGATTLTPVSADIGSNDRSSNTIAFTLTFDYADPQKAQIVAQDFVERLVKLDATQTSEQAAGTVEFLQEQANNLSTQIATIEGKIQQIKGSNGSVLSNSGMMMMPSGGGFQAQIANLQRENVQLQAQMKQQSNATDRDPAVVSAEAQLASVRAIYSDGHPDVLQAQQRLAEAKRFAAKNVVRDDVSTTIRNQIASNNAAIASMTAAQSSDQARTGAIMSAQSRAPVIGEEVSQLQARADGLRANYQAIATSLINARGSAKLSEQQKGERLSVIDPPVVADKPNWPNRPLLILGGIAAGGGLGLVLAFLLELIMRPIRGVAALQEITGAPPLVIVPKLSSTKKWFKWPRRRKLAPATASAGSDGNG